MSRKLILFLTALSLAGCSYLESSPTTTETATSTTTADSPVATTAPPETIPPGDAPCLEGDRPFVTDGLVSAFGEVDGDASQISGVRWASYPGCEQVTVDLLTADGAPAGSLDPVGVDYDATAGVVRVNLPISIARSAIADSLLDGEMVTRAFVVATGDGRIALDVHLAAGRGYAVRSYDVDSPRRIVIDIREDAEAAPVLGARVGEAVVVISPPTGPVGSSFEVTGYVKGSPESVVAVLVPVGSEEPVATQEASVPSTRNLWTQFTTTFRDVPGLELSLVVSPDGREEDAMTVPLDASTPAVADSPDV